MGTEEDNPDPWAQAQINLGLALRARAAEAGDAPARGEARACFTAARGYRAVGLHEEAQEAERLADAIEPAPG